MYSPPGRRGAQPGSASLTCTGANAAHAYACFQENSRDPTPGPFLLSPDGENGCLSLARLVGTEALPLRQGKLAPSGQPCVQRGVLYLQFPKVPSSSRDIIKSSRHEAASFSHTLTQRFLCGPDTITLCSRNKFPLAATSGDRSCRGMAWKSSSVPC